MPFLMQAPAPDILLRQQPDGVDLVGFDDTLDHPLDVGLPFVYKGIMHLLSAKRDIWTCDGEWQCWRSFAGNEDFGAIALGKPLAAVIHGTLLWTFMVARPSPAAQPEVYLLWFDMEAGRALRLVQQQKDLPPFVKLRPWQMTAKHGSQFVMCHEPLQHLDGPGGPTLFTFDLVTCHWSKLQVNGFDNTAVVGFGTHDGQVHAVLKENRSQFRRILCVRFEATSRSWIDISAQAPLTTIGHCVDAILIDSHWLLVIGANTITATTAGVGDQVHCFDLQFKTWRHCSWGQQLQDMAPNAILMLGKLKLMPSSTDGGQLAAALSKEASAWWPATPVAAFVLSGNRLKFAWANEPKQRDMPSMHGDDIIPGLERWCGNTNLSDVTLAVGDRLIRAHRLVLANASPVFARMFETDMRESVTSMVKIDDVAAEAMELLLHAMYACVGRPADSYSVELDEDSLPGGIPSQLALPLFLVADRYDVRGVRDAAVAALICGMHAASVMELVQVAEAHESAELADACIEFAARPGVLAQLWTEPRFLQAMQEQPELHLRFMQSVTAVMATD